MKKGSGQRRRTQKFVRTEQVHSGWESAYEHEVWPHWHQPNHYCVRYEAPVHNALSLTSHVITSMLDGIRNVCLVCFFLPLRQIFPHPCARQPVLCWHTNQNALASSRCVRVWVCAHRSSIGTLNSPHFSPWSNFIQPRNRLHCYESKIWRLHIPNGRRNNWGFSIQWLRTTVFAVFPFRSISMEPICAAVRMTPWKTAHSIGQRINILSRRRCLVSSLLKRWWCIVSGLKRNHIEIVNAYIMCSFFLWQAHTFSHHMIFAG